MCSVFSWFNSYCGPRTFSNSLEAQLTVIALYYWDIDLSKKLQNTRAARRRRLVAMVLSSLSVIIRPTALIFWCPVVLMHLYSLGSFREAVRVVFLEMAPVASVVLGLSTAADSIYFGEFTLVPLNFVYHNILHSVAEIYGTHSFWWYFTQGFPLMLGSFVPLFVCALALPFVTKGPKSAFPRAYGLIVLWNLLVYSALSHKEFRFVYPALYVALLVCGEPLQRLWGKARPLAVLLLGAQVPFMLFFGLHFQRAPIDVMARLRGEMRAGMRVEFLTPCHSTPFWAYMHERGRSAPSVQMGFLDCSPQPAGVLDEAEIFKADPLDFVRKRYGAAGSNETHPLPTHIVAFSWHADKMQPFFDENGYRECGSYPHNTFEGTTMNLYCKQDN